MEIIMCGYGHTSLTDGQYWSARDGGRTNSDGQLIEWETTFPCFDPLAVGESEDLAAEMFTSRGQLPCWCQDKTARSLRVPQGPAYDAHANGVTSIKTVTVLFREPSMKQKVDAAFEIIFKPGTSILDNSADLFFQLALTASQSDLSQTTTVHVKVARTQSEKRFIQVSGEGIYQVELRTATGGSILLPPRDLEEEPSQEPHQEPLREPQSSAPQGAQEQPQSKLLQQSKEETLQGTSEQSPREPKQKPQQESLAEPSQEAPREGAVTRSRKRKSEA